MCISGFYSINAFDFNNVILKMSSALSHRGPDSSRTWKDKNSGIIFGHQRLSIFRFNQSWRSTNVFKVKKICNNIQW